MPDIKISEVARLTGLSMRYWQRRALRGDMPGAHYFETGNRRIYFVDRDRFTSSSASRRLPIICTGGFSMRSDRPCLEILSAQGWPEA